MKINRETYESIIKLAGIVGKASDRVDEFAAIVLDVSEAAGAWLDGFAATLIAEAEANVVDEPVQKVTTEDIKNRIREAFQKAQQPKITSVDDFLGDLFKRETDENS